MNFASLSSFAIRRTRCQRTERALPGSESGTRFAGRVPLGQPPSLHHLRPRHSGLVRRLRGYYGAV